MRTEGRKCVRKKARKEGSVYGRKRRRKEVCKEGKKCIRKCVRKEGSV